MSEDVSGVPQLAAAFFTTPERLAAVVEGNAGTMTSAPAGIDCGATFLHYGQLVTTLSKRPSTA